MREILFRGKQETSMEWLYGDVVREDYSDFTAYRIENERGPFLTPHKNNYVDGETIGEWTGKADKIGTLIFEGDILRLEYGTESYYVVVKYDNRNACFIISNKNRGSCNFTDLLRGVLFTVSGNIYDNPELLENCDEQV